MTAPQENNSQANLGSRRLPPVRMSNFPNADEFIREKVIVNQSAVTDRAVEYLYLWPKHLYSPLYIVCYIHVTDRLRDSHLFQSIFTAYFAFPSS